MFKAITFEKVLSSDEVEKVLEFARSTGSWGSGGGDFWAGRSLGGELVQPLNREVSLIMNKAKNNIKKLIMENITNEVEVYPDLFQIVRWFDGMEQPPHADDMVNAGEGFEWFRHRSFGAILYLNDNYTGGHTYYPNYNIEIVPKPGMVAIHPGDSDHLHGVTKIEGAVRYTLASFWTYEKEYNYEWSLY
jgi:hypothetical protein